MNEDMADDEHKIVFRNQVMTRSFLKKYIVAKFYAANVHYFC